ncbi:HIT domain-containing protein [bacterium]|nr:HIT domain-containing protein [bacterium]
MDVDGTCIFCRIVSGAMPCHRVHEDPHTLVFMDIFPVADGHTLVITKQHAATIFEADETALTAVAATARRVAHAIRAVLAPDGLMVFQLNGAAAMQTVFHYHMHLLPRRADEPLALHTRVPGDPARLAELARQLAAALGRPPRPSSST